MILVTVGTHPQQFDRLVRAADDLAGLLKEQVIIQYGTSNYLPRHAWRSFAYTSGQEMRNLIKEARVVIAQAAAGVAILALQLGKPLVLVPRLKKYHEHIDNHQMQLAGALESSGSTVKLVEPNATSLEEAIHRALALTPILDGGEKIRIYLRSQLEVWQKS